MHEMTIFCGEHRPHPLNRAARHGKSIAPELAISGPHLLMDLDEPRSTAHPAAYARGGLGGKCERQVTAMKAASLGNGLNSRKLNP